MLGDDLKLLADRAYPDLPDEWITQVAFNVRQAKPKAVDEAVRLTLEMESYMQPTPPNRIAATLPDDYESDVVGAASTQP